MVQLSAGSGVQARWETSRGAELSRAGVTSLPKLLQHQQVRAHSSTARAARYCRQQEMGAAVISRAEFATNGVAAPWLGLSCSAEIQQVWVQFGTVQAADWCGHKLWIGRCVPKSHQMPQKKHHIAGK